MEALNACPHQGFDTWLLVSYFYDGISLAKKQLLETMCGGDFLSKNLEEALDFLNYVAEASKGWDEPNPMEMEIITPQPNTKDGMYHPFPGPTQLADPNRFQDARLILFYLHFIKFSFSKVSRPESWLDPNGGFESEIGLLRQFSFILSKHFIYVISF